MVSTAMWSLDFLVTPTQTAGLQRLTVSTVHGCLWLQTHFPKTEWEALLNGQACFGSDCLSDLLADATAAGLTVDQTIAVES